MKNLLKLAVAAVLAVGLTSVVSAQSPQYRTTHVTNATVTALQGTITSTNLAIFTAATARTYNEVTIQNVSTNAAYILWTAKTGATNAISAAGGIRLAPKGTVGDKVTKTAVVPQTIVISGQSEHPSEGATIQVEALGR